MDCTAAIQSICFYKIVVSAAMKEAMKRGLGSKQHQIACGDNSHKLYFRIHKKLFIYKGFLCKLAIFYKSK